MVKGEIFFVWTSNFQDKGNGNNFYLNNPKVYLPLYKSSFMSYMSNLEIKARNYYAIDVLNKLRHKLIGRSDDFSDKQAEILLDSIELYENSVFSNRLVRYSFYGMGNYEKSSALQLSEILKSTLNNLAPKVNQNPYIISLKKYLERKEYNNTFSEDKKNDEILLLVNSAIDNMHTSSILATLKKN